MAELRVVASELILGAPGSGKTARAEALARAWLDAAPHHRAVYVATAQAWDAEMRERLARQRAMDESAASADDGAARRMATVEEPLALAQALGPNGRADTLVVADCLTLWLAAQSMAAVSFDPVSHSATTGARPPRGVIAAALRACAGPLVLVSNEVGAAGLGPGQDAREFLASLGSMNQEAAAACERVTLMSAGAPLVLKGSS